MDAGKPPRDFDRIFQAYQGGATHDAVDMDVLSIHVCDNQRVAACRQTPFTFPDERSCIWIYLRPRGRRRASLALSLPRCCIPSVQRLRTGMSGMCSLKMFLM